MEKPVLGLLLFLALHFVSKAAFQDSTNWWNIDCGSEQRRRSDNRTLQWYTDEWFISSGFNKRVPQKQPIEEMNTLRFFPNATASNCYVVFLVSKLSSCIVRAGFYHGNYDGLRRPPTFDLTINGKKWTTVNTTSSMDGGPIYHEAIYVAHQLELDVCLVQTREGEVPFISSLEFMPIEDPLYTEMVPFPLTPLNYPNASFHLVTRTNFGGPQVRFRRDNYNDSFNRIWASGSTPFGCENVSTMPHPIQPLENAPPMAVLADSIASVNASDPIILTFDLPPLDGPLPTAFTFYFSNPAPESRYFSFSGINGTRVTQIYINGELKSNITFEWGTSQVVTIYPVDVMGPTINITLAPGPQSNLSTMISGLEVFTWQYEKYEVAAPPPPWAFKVPYSPPPPSSAASPLLMLVYIILSHVLFLLVSCT